MSRFTGILCALLLCCGFTVRTYADVVSGDISGTVVWDTAGSPYQVTGDIIIGTGDSLIIEPGVTVTFAAGADDQASGRSGSVSEIYVSGGHLIARGTATDSIIFTSDAGSPVIGDWGGISVYNHSSVNLDYCRISYAYYGIYGYYVQDSTTVRRTHIDQSYYGIYHYYNYDYAVARYDSVRVGYCTGYGIYGRYLSTTTIENCRIDSLDGSYAMYIRQESSGEDSSVVIRNNVLYGHGVNTGLYCYYIRPIVEGNTISDFQTGISLTEGPEPDLSHRVTGNTITGGSIGLNIATSASPTFHYNNVYGQSSYRVSHYGVNDLDAKYNYWGEDVTDSMEAAGTYPADLEAFYDYHDNSSYGTVYYFGWLDTLDGTPTDSCTGAEMALLDGPGGSARLYFNGGEDVYVQIDDNDENTDPGTAESLTVYLASATETTPETLVLTETGTATGIFAGSMELEENASPSADGILQADVDEFISVTYHETRNTGGVADTVVVTARAGVTAVSGDLSGRADWTAANSPYLVTGDVIVGSGDSLYIEAGVTVYFADSSDDQAAGTNANLAEIYVDDGFLEAVGASGDSIYFRGNSAAPDRQDWQAVSLTGDVTVALDYCVFTDGVYGVYGNATDGGTVDISRSRFTNVNSAIYVNQNQSACAWNITGNYLQKTYNASVYINYAVNTVISANRIDTCDNSHNIYINYSNGVDSTTVVTGNTITGDNTSNYGIYARYCRPIITGNTIDNCVYGIFCYESGTDLDHRIDENTVINGTYGLYLSGTSSPAIHNNDIHSQNTYQVYNDGSNSVDARFNYWGETATAEMEAGGNPKNISGIYDYYDNAARGEVYYFAWLDTADGIPADSVAATGVAELINTGGAVQACYQAGDTVFVRVTDADADADGGTAETLTVYFTSTTETSAESVLAVETGAATGIFEGFIVSDSSGTDTDDGLLQAAAADEITATYVDQTDDFGSVDTVTVTASYVISTVSGVLSGNTTWYKTGSPYVVTGDVRIDAGRTLTIEPGTEVYFTPGSDDQNSGARSDLSEIFVNGGRILAAGTAADTILFSVWGDTPAPGDWTGVYFGGSTSNGVMEHCALHGAMYGIYVSNVSADSIVLRNCLVESSSAYGVYIVTNTTGTEITVDSTTVIGNGSYGMYLSNSENVAVTDCDIVWSGDGIYLNNPVNAGTCAVISGNSITGTGTGDGIDAYNARPLISGNVISGFQYGLRFQNTGVNNPRGVTVTGNTITGGTYGVYLQYYSAPVLSDNDIYGQSGYQVYNTSSSDVTARNNYWGETATAEMEAGGNPKNISGIYDRYENANYGTVNYSAWLDTVDGTPAATTVTGEIRITDGSGADVYGLSTADTVYLELDDADLNQNAGAAEQVDVYVHSTTEAAAETVTLTETGDNTGVFSGYVLIDSSGSAAADGELQAVMTDHITATYADAADDFGNSSDVTDDIVAVGSVFSGNISGLTEWSAADGPYLVTGDVIISSGDTLRIGAGTIVLFMPGQDDQGTGSDGAQAEIYVASGGLLEVDGTVTDTVRFRSAAASPAAGDWECIYLNGTGTAHVDYCRIDDAVNGVYTSYQSADSSSFRHSAVQGGTYGVYFNYNNSGTGWLIDSCRFDDQTSSALYGYYVQTVTMSGNVIADCAGYGIYMRYNSGDDSTVVTRNNTVGVTGGSGIYYYQHRGEISGNTVSGHTGQGIYVYLSADKPNGQVIAGNTVTGGDYGVQLNSYPEPTLTDNSFIGQAVYALYNQSYNDISAQNNYWGATATAEMEGGGNPKDISTIYDEFDNATYGLVDYDAWLDTVGGTPATGGISGVVSMEDVTTEIRYYYLAGDTVYLRVRDTSPTGGTDTVSVLVASLTETVPETVRLAETSSTSGVFTGTIVTDSSSSPAVDGRIQAIKNDVITVIYYDDSDAYGRPDTSTTEARFGFSAVSGAISGTVTWDTAGSPYLVTGDIIIDAGDELVIEPGVTVYFADSSDDQSAGSNTSRCEIYCDNGGKLTAVGTASDSIVFTSINQTPAEGDWYAITIRNAAGLELRYARVEYAYYGVYGYYTNTGTYTVADCHFPYDVTGIYAYRNQSGGSWQIEDNHIRHSTGYGIYSYYSYNMQMSGNTIDSTGGYGVYTYYPYTDSSVRVEDNVFNGPDDGYAIYTTNCRPLISGNVINGYSYGMYLNSGSGEYQVRGNTVHAASRGIHIAGGAQPVLSRNTISGQNGYYVYNQSNYDIDCRFNWWGTALTDSMAAGAYPTDLAGIYDGFDNGSYGLVYYFGWLDSEGGSPTDTAGSATLQLTDASAQVQVTYVAGDTAYLAVTDYDANLSDVSIDTVTVLVSSETETDPETLRLAETGTATFGFAGLILLENNGTPAADGVLQAVGDDLMYAVYHDDHNGFGVPETVTTTARFGITELSGSLNGRLVLSQAGGPYLVTGDLLVESGDTLVIEAGTKVYFAADSDDQSAGSNTSRCEIYVNGGHLEAVGTLSDSVYFTSFGDPPGASDWQGIYLTGNSSAELAYCSFLYAYQPVYGAATSGNGITLRTSLLYGAGNIAVYIDNNSDTWLVDSCRIYSAGSYGVYGYQSQDVTVSNNLIEYPGSYGVYTYYPYGTDSCMHIVDNTILGTGSNYGIRAYRSRPLISGNTIDNFNQGINCDLGSSSYPSSMSITGNTITNGQYGVYLTNYAAPDINHNNIYGQSSYQVYTNTATDVDARYNYWGETATAEMEAGGNPKNIGGIYDYYDNGSYGEVLYFAWLDTADGLPADSTAGTGVLSLLNGSGGEQQVYGDGDTVYVQVDDADQNADPATAETLSADLTTDTETGAEAVMLIETGVNTGIFQGIIIIDSSAFDVADGVLQAVYADGIYASYDDPLDGFGQPSTITGQAAFQASMVSGAISGAVTWRKTGNPYIVTGDVQVPAGSRLTIEPGVEVYFTAGSDDQSSGSNGTLSEIWVNGGDLTARGTEADSILLTSLSGTPAAGDWGGIYVSSGGNARVAYSTIEYGAYGVYGNSTSDDSMVISHNRIGEVQYYGIFQNTNNSGCVWTVDSNYVHHTGSYGMYLSYPRNTTVTGNIIDTTGNNGMYVQNPINEAVSTFITGNLLRNGTNSNGIQLYNNRATLTDNVIQGYDAGIVVQLTSDQYDRDIAMTGNTVASVSYGLYASGYSQPVFQYNTVDMSSGYLVYNQTADDLNARFNYWGQTATAEMDAGGNPKDISLIYDGFDNANYGYVNYSAWLDTVGGTPAGTTNTGVITLTDNAGTAQFGFGVDDTLFLTLDDPDLDTDAGTAQSVTVAVTSTSEATPESVVLTETDVNTGIFTGYILSEAGGTPAADGIVQADKEDDVIATYADVMDDFGVASDQTDDAIYGVTVVSGGISGRETWTTTAGPFLVTGDIQVYSGDTLVIEPGVKVMFLADYDDQNAGNSAAEGEIYVNTGGYLEALGAVDDSIIFTSASKTPALGDWYAIGVYNTGSMRLDYARIAYASYGVYTSGLSGDSLVVEHSGFHANNRGLYLNSMQPGGSARIESCFVYKSSSYGMHLSYMRNTLIRGCAIDSTTSDAVYLQYGNGGDDSTITVDACRLTGDGGDNGIYAYNTRPVITDNRIDNYNYGYYQYQTSSGYDAGRIISGNTITGGSRGIYLTGYADPATIADNNLYGQSQYQLYNGTANSIIARNNYWGETSTAEMETGGNLKNITGIYDSFDNGAYGTIDYSAWLDTVDGVAATDYQYAQLSIEDGGGTPVDYVEYGDTVYVSVVDDEPNSGAVDTVIALISSPEEAQPETLVLAETGTATGIYHGFILADTGAAVTGDGVVQAGLGDGLTVTYIDTLTAYGYADTIDASVTWAPTLVSGAISGAVTWYKAASPYIVTGDVQIGSGDTLTIEPGVTVQFMVQDDQSAGLSTSRSEIYVSGSGRLVAAGTPSDSIVFTSVSETPVAGDWYAIYFTNTSSGRLEHCRIEYATYGVYSYYTNGSDSILVRNSLLRTGSYGIYQYYNYASNRFAVDSCRFEDYSSYSFRGYYSFNTAVAACDVRTVAGSGLYFYYPYDDSSDITLTDNVLTNTGGGSGYGIYWYRSRPTITGNTISGYGSGLYGNLGSASYPSEHAVSDNIITNGMYGVQLVSYASPILHNNTFAGQSQYKVYNQSTADIDARGNWWDQATTDSMAAGAYPQNIAAIYDYYDNASYGMVHYFGWLDTAGGTPEDSAFAGTLDLTDAADSVVSIYNDGDLVYVRVDDKDMDLTGAADTVTVALTTTSESTAESLDLVETGAATGLFKGSMALDDTGAVGTDGILQVTTEDFITASYTELRNQFGLPRTVEAQARYGLTAVTGDLDGRVTWTAGSAYLVTGDIYVGTGDTLVIQPGVTVYFAEQSDDQAAGSNTSRCEIYVNGGHLEALGTVTDSILFTSYASSPAANDWQAVYVGYGGTADMDYCRFSYGTYAVYGYNTNQGQVRVRHCRVDNMSAYGIYVYQNQSSCTWTIDSCHVAEINGTGIYLNYPQNTVVSNCLIDSSGGYGINVRYNQYVDSPAIITGNTISARGGSYGIYAYQSRPDITGNHISGFGSAGIYHYLSSSSYPTEMDISGNTITGSQYGLYVQTYGAPDVHYNNFIGQSMYQIYNASYDDIDARFNYWDAVSTDSMNAGGNPKNIPGIYDRYDNATYGEVFYFAWLDTADGAPVDTAYTGTVSLTDAAGVAKQCFLDGDTVWVLVTDPDRNLDDTEAETLSAYLTSDTEGTEEEVVLVETDTASGTFLGGLPVDSSATAAADGELQAVYGDNLYAAYYDDYGELGTADTSVTQASFMVSFKSGTIAGDEVWDSTGNPYLVTGDITISTDNSLTIGPGVRIAFAADSDDQGSGTNGSRCEIWVNGGYLEVNGTAAAPVTMASNGATPGYDDWQGVVFQSAGTGRISHCDISDANYGVYTNSPTSDSIVIRASTITNTYYGLYSRYTGSNCWLVLDSVDIDITVSYGMYLYYGARTVISNCTVDSTGSYCAYLNQANGSNDSTVFFINNTFDGGGTQYGINANSYRPQVSGNVFTDCSVDYYQAAAASGGRGANVLENNTFLSSGSYAVRLASSADPVLTGNSFLGDPTYLVYCQSTSDIDARNNYWGDSTMAEMAAGTNPKDISTIYDYWENSGYGMVNYAAWLDTAGGTPVDSTVSGDIALVSTAGDPVDGYARTDTLAVRLEDADLDTDTGSVQTVQVLITSTTETAAETLVLTETGSATGVFTGTMPFDTTGAAAQDGMLQVGIADHVYTSYSDAVNDYGEADTVTVSALYGVQQVSGAIAGAVTWTEAGGPYLVTGDILVGNGDVLTIEPGTEVLFMPGQDDQSNGSNGNLSEIYVSGTGQLLAEGTVTDSIRFRSAAESPAAGDWQTLYITGSGGSRVDYCRVDDATYGFYINSNQNDTVSVRHSFITGASSYGGYVYYSYPTGAVVIDSNRIHDCGSYGLYGRYLANLTISHNLIDSCNGYGIYVRNDYGGDDSTTVISDNVLLGLGSNYGIRTDDRRPTITGNYISNFQYGLYLDPDVIGSHEVSFNTIEGGVYGIYLYTNAMPDIRYNNIYGQTTYGIYNNSLNDIDAMINYWDPAAYAEMEAGQTDITAIYDELESASYGYVDFSNWRSIPVTDAPVLVSGHHAAATEDIPFAYTAYAIDRDTSVTPVISFGTLPGWLSADGDTVFGTPTEGMGDTVFSVIASDGAAAETMTVYVAVAPVNDPPLMISAAVDTATEDVPYVYTPLGYDVDGDTLTYSFIAPSWITQAGSTAAGTALYGHTDTVLYAICYDGEYRDTLQVNLAVIQVNDAPVITSAAADTATEDIAYQYIAAGDDEEGDGFTISFAGLPAWLTATGDTLNGTPTEGVLGAVFSVIADDGSDAGTLAVALTVVPVNDAPVITSAAADTATEESPYVYHAAASDPDGVPSLSFENVPSWLTAGGDSVYGTPDDPVADTSFTVIATDGELNDTLTVTLTVVPVNDAPVITSAAVAVALEQQPFTYTGTAADPDDTPVISFAAYPSWATPAGGILSGTPPLGAADTSFNVIADDGSLADTVLVTVTIQDSNRAPVITSAAADAATEDVAFTYVITATDPDGNPLAYQLLAGPAWLAISADTVAGTPLEGDGNTSFTVTASDGQLSDTLTVSLTVTAVNDAPVITSAAADTATEDVAYSYTATATDPDGTTPAISFSGLPAWLTAAGSVVSGTPLEGDGDVSFTVIADDGSLADTLTVALTVTPVNDAPVITSPGVALALEEQAFSYVAAATDAESVPVITLTDIPSWLTQSGDTLSGTPANGTPDTVFTIIASDGELADTQAVTVTVQNTNGAPVITSAAADTATEEIAYSYAATATDPDMNPVDLTFEDVPGWLTVTGTSVHGTPGEGVADTSFTVIAYDGNLYDTLAVALTVISVNDPPVITSAAADTATEEVAYSYTGTATDPDGTPVITFEGYPGWLSVAGPVISGTPDDPISNATFTVIASDGGLADTLVVSLTVNGFNDAPVITSAAADTAEDDVIYMYTATVDDPDDTPVITFAGYPAWLSPSGNVLSGTATDFTADDSFTVIASDGELADTIVVLLTVLTGLNEPPNPFSVMAGTPMMGLDDAASAWGDFDNDGDLDLVMSGSYYSGGFKDTAAVYENVGGSFTLRTDIHINGGDDGDLAWGDYNNDGWLDLLVTGYRAATDEYVATVYSNNGDGSFTELTGLGLVGVRFGAAEWVDFNNDGLQDMFITGQNPTQGPYRGDLWANNGDSTFTLVSSTGLPTGHNGNATWADYNNDGLADLLVTGYGYEGGTYDDMLSVYTNNGDSTFTVNASLAGATGLKLSDAAWGDYDNDGWIDFAVCGQGMETDTVRVTRLYHNEGDGTFSLAGAGLTGVEQGAVAWGDYNGDGWLDLAVTGKDTASQSTLNEVTTVFRNNGDGTFTAPANIDNLTTVKYSTASWADVDNDGTLELLVAGHDYATSTTIIYDNDAPANTAPDAPSGTASLTDYYSASLSWSPAGDAQQGSAGLTYNVKVGTAPGTDDILSAGSAADGYRLIMAVGNAGSDTSFFIDGLPLGTYYWQVQAVDNGFLGGAFSAVDSFVIDGLENVKDIVPRQVADGSCLVFANPAERMLKIFTTRALPGPLTVSVLDGHGRAVRSVRSADGTIRRTLDLRGCGAGVYYVRVEAPGISEVRSLILK